MTNDDREELAYVMTKIQTANIEAFKAFDRTIKGLADLIGTVLFILMDKNVVTEAELDEYRAVVNTRMAELRATETDTWKQIERFKDMLRPKAN